MSTIHIHEDQLERYTKDLLSEPEQRRCEEHLLICEACRDALEETEAYVSAMRAAARHFLRTPSVHPSPRWWPLRAVPVWAAAAAMVSALVPLSVYQVRRRPLETPVTVNLRAMRGLAAETEAAGKPLVLELDVSGLPRYDAYRIDLVNEKGLVLWGKAVRVQGSEVRTQSPALPLGLFFVRVYSPPGELLREYSLRVVEKW
jgi:hypothetical protein